MPREITSKQTDSGTPGKSAGPASPWLRVIGGGRPGGHRSAVRRVLVYAVVGTAFAGPMAVGCGDDTTGGPGPVEEAGPDQMDTSVAPDTSDSTRADVSQQADVSQEADAFRQDVSQQPDVTADVTGNDVRQDVAPDVAADVVADTVVPDANEAGGDSGDSGTVSGDAGDAGDASDAATCTTTVGQLESDGGVDGGALAPALLFAFDNGPLDGRWGFYPTTGFTSALTPTEGHICPGALALNATATAYGVNAGLNFNFGNPGQDWTGRKRLHFWIKLVTSNYGAFNGVVELVQSNNFGDTRYGTSQTSPPGYFAATAYSGGGWIESVVDLTPPPQDAGDAVAPDYDPANVNYFEIRLIALPVPDGGGSPPPATLLVDDIWLE
jgi:hypothetical protein